MWSDRETTRDCLGFEAYVESLAGVCLDPDVAPLCMGIFGSWGSGKTSLMKMLQAHIEGQWRVKTVWANAWRYEGKDEIQSALIHAMLAKLQEEQSLVTEAKDALARLKKGASVLKLGKFIGKTMITMTPDIGGLIDCFTEESEKLAQTMSQFEADFETLLDKVEVDRIVVFVDDLDRCQSAKVIEAFETIKLFLNMPKCTFVIGADAPKIEQAIAEYYKLDRRAMEQDRASGRTFAEDYLEKIVQIPFRIPEQRLRDIEAYVGILVLKAALTPESWTVLLAERSRLLSGEGGVHEGLVGWVASQAAGCFSADQPSALARLQATQPYIGILARGLRGNPRQIKRFLNILELRRRLAQTNGLDVQGDVLIKVLVLEYTWSEFFHEVADGFDAEAGRSEVLAELIRLDAEGQTEDSGSDVLTSALATPGLREFVRAQPTLHDIDLGPYLYLSQTALHVQAAPLTPPEEDAKELAERIASTDRIRSRSAARQAARSEGGVAAAIVRQLGPKLLASTNSTVQVQIVNGITAIAERHPGCIKPCLDIIAAVDFSKNQALGVAVEPLLRLGEGAGLELGDLRDRATQSSPLSAALAKPKSAVRRPSRE